MLTKHFQLEEFIHSETAERSGIDNTPDSVVLDNIQRTAERMETIRDVLDARIIITSGYRCPRLNKLIGGSEASAHLYGLACDFIAPEFGPPLAICKRLLSLVDQLQIDQLIYELTWVHVGWRGEGGGRHQVLTFRRGSYENGLIA